MRIVRTGRELTYHCRVIDDWAHEGFEEKSYDRSVMESRFEFLAVILRERVFGMDWEPWFHEETLERAADWAVGRIESHGCLTSVN